MNKAGISTAAAAMVGIVISVVMVGLLVAARAPTVGIYPNAVAQGVAAVKKEAQIKLSLAYYVGDKIAISNDGDLPVRIIELIIDGLRKPVNIHLDPGDVSSEIEVGYAPGDIAAVLEDGGIIPLLSHPEKVICLASLNAYTCTATHTSSVKTTTLVTYTTKTSTKTITTTSYSTYWIITTVTGPTICTTTITSMTTIR